MQRFEQHDSRVIAGKGSTRRICAMKTGRKTHDQQSRLRISKGLNGLTGVTRILCFDLIEKSRKPSALTAIPIV